MAFAGCKSSAPDDATLTKNVQNTLTQDNSLSGQPIQVSVQGGVATLSGAVNNDAQSTLASRDAAAVAGVKQVQNNLTVAASSPVVANVQTTAPTVQVPVSAPVPLPAPAAAPVKPGSARSKPLEQPERHVPAPIERAPQQQASNPPPAQPASAAAPPQPAAPTFKTVTVASGSTIPVRVTQTLDSATTQEGATFSGVVASDIVVDGVVAIPSGSPVSGRVDAVQDAGHFKGTSLLTVSLATVTRRGEHIPVTSDPYSVQGKGRGMNTAEKAGGGAAVGALLGGIFGGGKGAAIGAAAGGGVGAGSNAVTRGQQVQIASESVVRFHLAAPISVRVRTDGGGERRSDDNGLQPRPNP